MLGWGHLTNTPLKQNIWQRMFGTRTGYKTKNISKYIEAAAFLITETQEVEEMQ